MNKKAEEEILKQEATKLLAHIQTAGSHQEEAHQGPLAPPTDWPYWQRWQAVGNNWQPAGGLPPAGYQADPPGFAPLRDGEELVTPAFPAQELELEPESIDIVIPYSLENDGAELRYCLRSLMKNLIGLGRIFLVGEQLPSWLRPDGQRLIHLPVPDICQIADVAIWHKLFMACQEVRGKPTVSDRFLFVSDDQVLLRPVSAKQFGPYHYGDIQNLAPAYQDGWWARLRHTGRYLQQHGKTTLHGDVHAPILMERDRVLRIMAETAWRPAPGLCVGTLYLNWTGQADKATAMGPRIAVVSRPMNVSELRRELAGRWFATWTEQGFSDDLYRLLEDLFSETKPVPRPTVVVKRANTKRNLVFHLWPVRSNDLWRRWLRRLMRVWPKFNGRKIIGCVVDHQTVPWKTLCRQLPDDAEWIVQRNNPQRGEGVTWELAMQMVKSLEPTEMTCYGHGKGVSPAYHVPERSRELQSILMWGRFLYRFTMALDTSIVESILERWPCAGSLKKHEAYRQEVGRPPSLWHYSGTFFWLNHQAYFSHPESLKIGQSRWAVERHLGELFPVEQAYCIAGDHMDHKNLYIQPPEFWRSLALASLASLEQLRRTG